MAQRSHCARRCYPPPRPHRVPSLRIYRRREPEHSALYAVLQSHLESFLAQARSEGDGLPKFVERELRAFLRCGILAHGFARVHCDACGHDRLVAFSCKGRGFCPSCGGKRMTRFAGHLIDEVLPVAPVRQWVLTVPYRLRYRMAYDHALHHTQAIGGVFAEQHDGTLRFHPLPAPTNDDVHAVLEDLPVQAPARAHSLRPR